MEILKQLKFFFRMDRCGVEDLELVNDAVAIQQIDTKVTQWGARRRFIQCKNVEIPFVNQLQKKTKIRISKLHSIQFES